MYVSDQIIAPIEHTYGTPIILTISQEIDQDEMTNLLASQKYGRAHDITFFIFNGEGQVALIRKHTHPPGVYRVPSGGLQPGEDFEAGTLREAEEETGLAIRLERYLLRIHATFSYDGRQVPWTTHILCSHQLAGTIRPIDTKEIAEARYSSLRELQGPIRGHLLRTGRGLFQYRVFLTDRAVEALARS